jgi:hypothetical protein
MIPRPVLSPYFDHDSPLPVPAPVPAPPDPFLFIMLYRHLRTFDDKILGGKNSTAPSDAPINGIGVAPGWLTDTRPAELDRVRPGAIPDSATSS